MTTRKSKRDASGLHQLLRHIHQPRWQRRRCCCVRRLQIYEWHFTLPANVKHVAERLPFTRTLGRGCRRRACASCTMHHLGLELVFMTLTRLDISDLFHLAITFAMVATSRSSKHDPFRLHCPIMMMWNIKCSTFTGLFFGGGGNGGVAVFWLLYLFVWREPSDTRLLYYCLCKHVIFLSNEPYTGSVMKQLALTRPK